MMPDKPPQSEGERTQPASNEFIQQLAEAISRLAEKKSAEYSAGFSSAVVERLTESEQSAKAQAEAMGRIAERLGELSHQAAARVDDLDLPQKRAVLRYDAFCTALGRTGATSVVIGTLVGEGEHERLVLVSGQQLPGVAHKFVAFDKHGNELDVGAELKRRDSNVGGRGRGKDTYEWSVAVSGHGQAIAHFEVSDHRGPRWLGLMQPHAHGRANS